jgi:hypothetical protein|tara:strand:- start:304 stop:687 length:384 start_codon:yes stop_codon:yes gene_type:complete
MKPRTKLILAILSIPSLIFVGVIIDVESKNNKIIQKKSVVYTLINVGDHLDDAEQILKSNNYQLYYKEAIDPTQNGDYLLQMVVINKWDPSIIDTIGYVANINLPFGSESPYIIINTTPDRIITEIK